MSVIALNLNNSHLFNSNQSIVVEFIELTAFGKKLSRQNVEFSFPNTNAVIQIKQDLVKTSLWQCEKINIYHSWSEALLINDSGIYTEFGNGIWDQENVSSRPKKFLSGFGTSVKKMRKVFTLVIANCTIWISATEVRYFFFTVTYN